jgi:hypothetical protein
LLENFRAKRPIALKSVRIRIQNNSVMKKLLSLSLCCLAAVNINAQLFDDFNDGVIDAGQWSTFYPSFGNSSLLESSGDLRFHNGAWITSVWQFQNPTITGRFSINGWAYDRFKVILRSDGVTIDNHWQTRIGGLGIQFTSGANPDYGVSQTLQLWNFQTGTLLATAAPTINMGTAYDFSITDSGSAISVYLNNSPVPVLTYATSLSYGNYVEFGNREQAAGSGPPPYYVNLDYVSIVPEPSSLAILACFGALAALRRRSQQSVIN